MRAHISLIVTAVLCSTLACRGGIDSPTRPEPPPPPALPPPAVPPPPIVPLIPIVVGEVVHATVGIEDAICDPVGWDANAPCKRFKIVAPHDGRLEMVLKPTPPVVGNDIMDMILSCSSGFNGYSGGGLEQHLSAPLLGGQWCLVTINMYAYMLGGPGTLEFELRSEITDGAR